MYFKYSDGNSWTNSLDPDQVAQRNCSVRNCAIFAHSAIRPINTRDAEWNCSKFRISSVMNYGVRKFWTFTVNIHIYGPAKGPFSTLAISHLSLYSLKFGHFFFWQYLTFENKCLWEGIGMSKILKEWQIMQTLIKLLLMSSFILVYAVYSDLSARIFKVNTINYNFTLTALKANSADFTKIRVFNI